MIPAKNEREDKRRDLNNALAGMSNVLWTIQHTAGTWRQRMQAMEQLAKTIPLVIRYMIYLEATKENYPEGN